MAGNAQKLTLTMPTDTEMLRDIWQKMPILDTLLSNMNAMKKRVDDIEDRLKVVETHYTDLDHGVSYIETQMEEVSTAIAMKANTSSIEELNAQVVDLVNRNKRNNVILHNIPEKTEGEVADCSALVDSLAKHVLGINQSMEIERAHRTPMGRAGVRNQGNGPQRPRMIHVRFLRFRDRETFLRLASSKGNELKVNGNRFFVSDDVHQSTRKEHQTLMTKVRELRAAGDFAFIPWSVPRVIKHKAGGKGSPGPLKTIRINDI